MDWKLYAVTHAISFCPLLVLSLQKKSVLSQALPDCRLNQQIRKPKVFQQPAWSKIIHGKLVFDDLMVSFHPLNIPLLNWWTINSTCLCNACQANVITLNSLAPMVIVCLCFNKSLIWKVNHIIKILATKFEPILWRIAALSPIVDSYESPIIFIATNKISAN